jgi:energy-coupling factor transporter ATP-binding protein EcfA2
MKLSRLIVKQTPGVGDLDFTLSPTDGGPAERAVLHGGTGSGKTALLKLLSAMYRLPMAYTRPDGLAGVGYCAAWVDLDSVLYPPHLRPADTRRVVLAAGDKSLHTVGGGAEIEETAACWVDAEGKSRLEVPPRGRSRSVGATVAKMRQGKMEGRGGLLHFPETRELGKSRMEGIKPVETNYEWIWEYKTRSTWTGSVEAWLVWQNYLDLEDLSAGREAYRFGRVAELINDVLTTSRIAGVQRGRVQICPAGDSATRFTVDALSSGERQIFLLITEAARRLRPGCLWAIDCPERCLDPTAQVRLLAGLERLRAQTSAQLLVTTVSRHVRDWFNSAERFELADDVATQSVPRAR